LDEAGALIAARVLPRPDVGALLVQIVDKGPETVAARGFAAGLALRGPAPSDGDDADPDGDLLGGGYDATNPLARLPAIPPALTGKAKLAAWMADALVHCPHATVQTIAEQTSRGALGGDRMVLGRAAAKKPSLLYVLCNESK